MRHNSERCVLGRGGLPDAVVARSPAQRCQRRLPRKPEDRSVYRQGEASATVQGWEGGTARVENFRTVDLAGR